MIESLGTDGGDALLSLSGELDLGHVEELWRAARESLDGVAARLVIDASGVTFIDSSILGALIRISRAAEERGKDFALRRPAPLVVRLLHITGLDDRFEIDP